MAKCRRHVPCRILDQRGASLQPHARYLTPLLAGCLTAGSGTLQIGNVGGRNSNKLPSVSPGAVQDIHVVGLSRRAVQLLAARQERTDGNRPHLAAGC